MKIIQDNSQQKPFTAQMTCTKCKSVLEVTKADVRSDIRNESYIQCPICQQKNYYLPLLSEAEVMQAYYNK